MVRFKELRDERRLLLSRLSTNPVVDSSKEAGPKFMSTDIKETIKGFNMIMDGELDRLPEAAFNLKGTIEEAIEAGEKMLAEA